MVTWPEGNISRQVGMPGVAITIVFLAADGQRWEVLLGGSL